MRHVDRFTITIDVESVDARRATVLSVQDWIRVVRGSDGKETRIRTGVTHRESWKKADGAWKMDGFTEENQAREQLENAAIKDPKEVYEIHIRLVDPGVPR